MVSTPVVVSTHEPISPFGSVLGSGNWNDLSFWHDINRTTVDNATTEKNKHFFNDFVFMVG